MSTKLLTVEFVRNEDFNFFVGIPSETMFRRNFTPTMAIADTQFVQNDDFNSFVGMSSEKPKIALGTYLASSMVFVDDNNLQKTVLSVFVGDARVWP